MGFTHGLTLGSAERKSLESEYEEESETNWELDSGTEELDSRIEELDSRIEGLDSRIEESWDESIGYLTLLGINEGSLSYQGFRRSTCTTVDLRLPQSSFSS